jgi:hypothetical protein
MAKISLSPGYTPLEKSHGAVDDCVDLVLQRNKLKLSESLFAPEIPRPYFNDDIFIDVLKDRLNKLFEKNSVSLTVTGIETRTLYNKSFFTNRMSDRSDTLVKYFKAATPRSKAYTYWGLVSSFETVGEEVGFKVPLRNKTLDDKGLRCGKNVLNATARPGMGFLTFSKIEP